ncbi:MAG: hypothetical protein RML75_14505, partial [Cyanobacteriota bacterium SKYGB_h_bin112]|nr:hypothetical protein [Cyanobacteriota bacterium SKYGB_h_bin112]
MQGSPLPPPPQPLPDRLWGDRWRFATLPAAQLVTAFQDQPIPVLHLPEQLHPLTLGIASSAEVPGLVIDGGRRSLTLARWLQAARPVAATCIPGPPGGLVLATETGDR